MSRVAILGAGAMGSRMAQNLINAGHSVFVYSRTVDKVTPLVNQGAIYCATPREAAATADVIISMVSDNEASRTIWLTPDTGAIAGLSPDQIAIESSTLTVDWVKELAAKIAGTGAAFLDAPVVGSLPQIEAQKLIYLVGGETETLTKVQEILKSAGGSIINHLGEIGKGMAMKLGVNALLGTQIAALAEIIGFLAKNGITGTQAMECLVELPVMSPVAKLYGNLMLSDNRAVLFPIALMEKDFRYVLETAESVNAVTPVSAAIQYVFQEAIAQGYGEENITSIIQTYNR